jgi:elongation factor Ts
VDKIVQGRMAKFYAEECLLEQPYIRDEKGKQTVGDLLKEYIAKLGENLRVKRFVRMRIGED